MIDAVALAMTLCTTLFAAAAGGALHRGAERTLPAGPDAAAAAPAPPDARRAAAATVAPPRPADAWIGEDKVQHLTMSYAVTVFLDAGARTVGVEERTARIGALGGALMAGVLKEVYDRTQGGSFSYRDLVWDAAGVAAGLVVMRHSRRP